MTVKNIISGLRTTGVFPLNRHAVLPKPDCAADNLSKRPGIAYLPLYTPVKRYLSCPSSSSPSFSQEELMDFELTNDQGLECDDPKYSLWSTSSV